MTSDSETAPFTNRLAAEKSPYLLQHAHNPVDWFPWGDEAFEKARSEDKPVLVSIGYATCHWCHVMERESFESEDLAAYLNEHFVPIKVDREERPDVDKIYMDALHALGEQGGWPLNMFLTPEGVPFTGGTYFPPRPRFGRPSFRQVLERIQQLWSTGRDRIEQTAGELRSHLEGNGRTTLEGADEELTRDAEERMVQFARNTYDRLDGGFQHQPRNKFPPSMSLMHLLRIHERASDEGLVEMIEHTLERMKSGGIYDQLGGGLSRYSTDYQWLVPHFEKMLYDNALWVQCLVEVGQALGGSQYRDWAADTLAYIKRDMTSPEGAFYSAEDADSEGVEGKFYVWAKAELEELLDETTAKVAIRRWGVTEKGNFEGANILHVARTIAQVAAETELDEAEVERRLAEAREVLFKNREGRIRPLCDDKVLVSWNALMISAMAKFGRAYESADELERAVRAGEFILREMVDESGRLLRRWRDGEARYKAYLVDHAQLAVACLDLFEATEDRRWFREAVRLCEAIETLFRDPEGAYYDTGSDAETLLTRTTESYDGVEPSGNSATAWAFLRLYTLTGEDRWRDGAERILRCFASEMERRGPGCAFMLRSLDFLLGGCGQLIVVGDASSEEYQAVRRLIRTRFIADASPLLVPAAEFEAWREDFPVLEGRGPDGAAAEGHKVSIYLCRNQTCGLPMHSAGELEKELF